MTAAPLGDRPTITLTFPGPAGPMVARASLTLRGAEVLWAALTDALREKLTAGGCGGEAFQMAILRAADGPTVLDLREDDAGRLLLAATPKGSAGTTITTLVEPALIITFTLAGEACRLPLPAPVGGDLDAWHALPPRVRAALEHDGQTKASVNALVVAQLGGNHDGMPVVQLDIEAGARARGASGLRARVREDRR